MKKLILITVISISSLLATDFSRNNETNIVTDNRTKLEWQDNDSNDKMNLIDAIDTCETLNLGGREDWRLANINELLSLVDEEKSYPAIDRIFKNILLPSLNNQNFYYWSSTISRYKDKYTDKYRYFAATAEFKLGKSGSQETYDLLYSKCVRDIKVKTKGYDLNGTNLRLK